MAVNLFLTANLQKFGRIPSAHNLFITRHIANAFFRALIDNKLYDLPDQNVIDHAELKNHAEAHLIKDLRDNGSVYIELKVLNHYRSAWLANCFYSIPMDRQYSVTELKESIIQILSPFN